MNNTRGSKKSKWAPHQGSTDRPIGPDWRVGSWIPEKHKKSFNRKIWDYISSMFHAQWNRKLAHFVQILKCEICIFCEHLSRDQSKYRSKSHWSWNLCSPTLLYFIGIYHLVDPFTIGWIPRNFRISFFSSNLPFLRQNHKNDNLSDFFDFYEFALYMNFAIFLKMTISKMVIFVKILKIIFRVNS